MTNNNYDNQTTGGIVAANFAAASVFHRHAAPADSTPRLWRMSLTTRLTTLPPP